MSSGVLETGDVIGVKVYQGGTKPLEFIGDFHGMALPGILEISPSEDPKSYLWIPLTTCPVKITIRKKHYEKLVIPTSQSPLTAAG